MTFPSSFVHRLAVTLCCLIFNQLAFGQQPATPQSWSAGIAKVKITPDKPIWMSGYGGRNKPAEGKLTDLWAKVLVLQDAEQRRVVLITLDLVGIGRRLSQAICADLKGALQFERAAVAICTSHTHTGPVVGRNLEPLHYMQVDAVQQRLIDQYAETLRKKVLKAVVTASHQLKPVTVAWGNGRCTLATNRRENKEAEVPKLRQAGQLKGPVDHDVPVLAVRASDGQLRCVVFGYACHATVLSFYKWSGDYPGFAQAEVEQTLKCQAMFWAGCGADQNPLPRRTVELAQSYGRRLGQTVVDVVGGVMTPVAPRLVAKYTELKLPLGPLPSKAEIERDTKSSNRFIAARARLLLAQLNAGKPLPQHYPYPVGTWQLGEASQAIQWVTLGGEVVVDYANRLKLELRQTNTWVAGYANDVMAYIPSRRVLREGGYEGATAMIYYGLPTSWAPTVENMIVNEVHRQLKDAQESP